MNATTATMKETLNDSGAFKAIFVPIYGSEKETVGRPKAGERVIVGFALVDECDEDLVRGHRWIRNGRTGHAATKIDGRVVKMHRLIAEPADGEVVHHVNGNPHDNRRANLATMPHGDHSSIHAQDQKGVPAAKATVRSTTGYPGVFREDNGTFTATCCGVYLGRHDTLREAVNARSLYITTGIKPERDDLQPFRSNKSTGAKYVYRLAWGVFQVRVRKGDVKYTASGFKTIHEAVEARDAFLASVS